MNAFVKLLISGLLFFAFITPQLAEDKPEKAAKNESKADLTIRLPSEKSKEVTVSAGQSAMAVFNLCKPAKVYVDDDPWLICPAADGGRYLLMFASEGTVKELKKRLDPNRDKLYAAVHYPKKPGDKGRFLLPKSWNETACGEFVTPRVRLDGDKAKVATVTLGMSTDEVTQLLGPAPDRRGDDRGIVYDSIGGGKYLLVFAPPKDKGKQEKKRDALSEVFYRPPGKAEALYLLPREKRGKAVPGEYKKLLIGAERED